MDKQNSGDQVADPAVVSADNPDEVLRACFAAFNPEPARSGALLGVRTFRHGVIGKRIFYFASRKNDGHLICEGDIEYSLCFQLEWSQRCAAYRTQPLTLTFIGGSTYTPDVLIRSTSGALEAIECKPHGQRDESSVALTRLLATEAFERANIKFNTFTDRDLWTGARQENLLYLYQHVAPMRGAETLARAFFKTSGPHNLKALRSFLAEQRESPRVAEFLLWSGHVRFDWDRRVGPATRLELGARNVH